MPVKHWARCLLPSVSVTTIGANNENDNTITVTITYSSQSPSRVFHTTQLLVSAECVTRLQVQHDH